MAANEIKNTEDVLAILCDSVSNVLTTTTQSEIKFSPMIQKIGKTCLKPDIGCFVLFEGAFSGLIIINLTADAAIELYQKHMLAMGMPQEELSSIHTSDDVGNLLSELMNQIVGDFQGELEHQAMLSINQTQPKMLVVNKELVLSINTNLERPQSRRVVFSTENRNTFYLEMSMEKTEFTKLKGFSDNGDEAKSKSETYKKMMDDLDI